MSLRLLRRDFLVGLGLIGSGLAIASTARAEGVKMPSPLDKALKIATAEKGEGLQPNLFVHITPDDVVAIVCARSEMGQGVRSSLPALIADELGADLPRIKIVQAPGSDSYGDQNTDGSHSVRGFYDELRKLGAVARMMLVSAAAKRWNVPEKDLVAVAGTVSHAASKRSVKFGDLANDAAKLPLPDVKAIVLKPKSELRWVGKELPFVDAPDIVMGKAVYGADVKLPGMLTAVIARPPVVGGSVKSHDASKTLGTPGVKQIFVFPPVKPPFAFKPVGGIAVIATDTWSALRGRAALDVTWNDGDNAVYDSREFKTELLAALKSPGKSWRDRGNFDDAFKQTQKQVVATYYAPHLAHATMEPPVAIARVDGDKCEIWAATQNPQDARKTAAEALGVPLANVTVHVTMLGGGFGRKSKADFIAEAALVSRAAKAPVRVQWTREDDIQHDYYHSVSAQELSAGIDEHGKVIAFRHKTTFPPIGSTFSDTKSGGEGELQQGVTDVPLDIPNLRAECCDAKAYTRIGWLRSVANIYHAFAGQSFMDEVAHALGKDPLAMRYELFGPARKASLEELGLKKLPNYGQSLEEHPIDVGRYRHVLERVTTACDWANRAKSGRALGLAVHRSFLAYVAVVVAVIKTPEGKIKVDEAWITADAGTIVNLERVRSQLEGAVIFGLSHALYGEITMKAGATEQTNFRDYRLMRLKEAPRAIHVEVVPSDLPPSGVGEPGVPPVAPALANAIFALTGQRIRDLPISRSLQV